MKFIETTNEYCGSYEGGEHLYFLASALCGGSKTSIVYVATSCVDDGSRK